ncbi:MAG: valine--tRNA ligase [Bacillota bacterium]|jgi:valyl-tRNA synthetase
MNAREDFPKVYDPARVESKWYQEWLDRDLFRAEVRPEKVPFTIVIPPPNVTGSLHMGHALDETIQDVLARWRRMQGYEVLWLPGTDHAGIATQHVVDASLSKEGTSRYDVGRERFIEKVWEWKDEYGNRIVLQLQRLGCSCDWSRLAFTMDEKRSRAVREVFASLYRKGLIYRGDYIINWCPECKTALSDIEVEHEEHKSSIWYVRYPLESGKGFITVATTRPETILGDTAVAVNPSDERYKELVGLRAVLPVLGRPLPIVADEYVDPSFGSGAVKVTPAHDPNDFEIATRHGLSRISVIDPSGRMTQDAGPYAGLDRYECRKALLEELDRLGLLVRVEEYTHSVGQCYRCDTVIEPLLSRQWFVRMKPLAQPAMEAVLQGRVRFVPERFTKIYLNWMENIRDWCISRQIWWGHRIPAWYCRTCQEIMVTVDPPEACACGSQDLEQDEDVLDTWFSSALWPFSTLGWPEDSDDLRYFYPTSVLVTGYDIIFFWVARMMVMGEEFMKEEPFRNVLIHGLVRDAQGRKMSKSLGNGIDPLEVIEKYGADTLRFTLMTGNTPGNDMRFYWERVESSRNFANKIWNATRFVLMNLEGHEGEGFGEPVPTNLAERWILSRYASTVRDVTGCLERYELGEAARLLYDFVWDEFCDWYVEMSKTYLYHGEASQRRQAQGILGYVLLGTMQLLHPFMPFISEEIWNHLEGSRRSIVGSSWPRVPEALLDAGSEETMTRVKEVVRAIRNLRAEVNVPPSRLARVVLQPTSDSSKEALQQVKAHIESLAMADPLVFQETGSARPDQALAAVTAAAEVYLPLVGLVDVDKEVERLERDLALEETELERVTKRLSNKEFLNKAPQEIVQKERGRQHERLEKVSRLKARIDALKGT